MTVTSDSHFRHCLGGIRFCGGGVSYDGHLYNDIRLHGYACPAAEVGGIGTLRRSAVGGGGG